MNKHGRKSGRRGGFGRKGPGREKGVVALAAKRDTVRALARKANKCPTDRVPSIK
jgi:hypothetical protein